VKWRCCKYDALDLTTLDTQQDPLLVAYHSLLVQNIACHWRVVSSQNTETEQVNESTAMQVDVTSNDKGYRELWIFWWGQEEPDLTSLQLPGKRFVFINDRGSLTRCASIDSRLGSFSWDAVSAAAGTMSRLAAHIAPVLPDECDLFIAALRNLCTQ
jgi:hypothetical protein